MAKKKITKVQKLSVDMPTHLREKSATPEQIAAWRRWTREKEKLQKHPKRYVLVPDPDSPEESIQIDLIQAVWIIKKKLSHLPKDYVEGIMLTWKDIQRAKTAIGVLKRKWNPPLRSDPESLTGLNTEQNAEIIELFGTWKTNNEVRKVIMDKWGYDVKSVNISAFKMANKDRIDGLRSSWEKSYDGFDISHKRGRIERLAFLAKTQMDKYKHRNAHSVVHSREIRAILDQIKKEIEGDKIKIDVEGNIDVNATINMNQSVQRLTQRISINSFVIALVASKRGIDSTKLMQKLINSFYSQYNGFMRVTDSTSEPEYPSNLIQTYDWNEIDRMHNNNDVVNYEEAVVIEEEKPKEGDLKSQMMKILMDKQSKLDKIGKKK